jgi:hypothetical protein
MSKKIEAAEVYAFVEVVAPRLEQLRRRLVSANNQLKTGDPETARLAAIMESQLAIKEFLNGITHLAPLTEPIDALLEAIRDESAEREAPPPEPPPPEPAAPPPAPVPLADTAKPSRNQEAPADMWLRVGTAIAIERLMNAGMPVASAESYVQQSYAAVGLRQFDGSPISDETVREWRVKFAGPAAGGWRRKAALKQRIGSQARGANTLSEAQRRVDQMAALFKRMAQLAASRR